MKDIATWAIGVLGIIAGLYATRVSREATRVSRETNQIKWLQEAKDDAADAKRESREAKDEVEAVRESLAETRRDLSATKLRLGEASDQIDELTRWALRVVAWTADVNIDRDELRELINGGPPSLRLRPPTERGPSERP